MMWAPIANNVISIVVLALYLSWFGPLPDAEGCAAFTRQQELVLGLGSTLGIVAQTLILLPYLRSAGFRFRARYDFRHTGLGHTLRLGVWTVLFVVVNQAAFRSWSGSPRAAPSTRRATTDTSSLGEPSTATGYTVYAAARCS